MKRFVQQRWLMMLALSIFTIAILWVFAPVLGKYAALHAPDSPPFFIWPWRWLKLSHTLSNPGTFTPHLLYWLWGEPLYAHELTYMLDSLILALGVRFYLRTQGVHPWAAWFGGFALAFSGYSLTLFSAGHRGYFHMFSCAVWGFGLIARGFTTRKILNFAWLGLILAWGIATQPDVLLLVAVVLAAYTLWQTWQSAKHHQETVLKVVHKVWPRFLITLMVLVLAGYAGIRTTMTTHLITRETQLEVSAGTETPSTDPSAELSAAEKQARWLFATNWSLPPEDLLEFLVPGIFGNDSVHPPYPYWGRLGRPDASQFTKGQTMPNYRQHTVYLGLITLLFAVFALMARGQMVSATPLADAAKPKPTPKLVDLPFWCGVWMVCLLLAMGRFTPLYRLFYALPYMSYIRAPIKFLHLVELATAVLAAFGMHCFMVLKDERVRRRLWWLALGVTLILLLGALAGWIVKPAIIKHVMSLGMPHAAPEVSDYLVANLLRAALVSGLAGGIIWYICKSRLPYALTVGVGMVVLVAVVDQATVARRYVRVLDVAPLYRKHAVITLLKQNAAARVPTVVNYVTQNNRQDWFSASLEFQGVRNLTPKHEDLATAYGHLFMASQQEEANWLQRQVRLWHLLQAQAVILPYQQGATLVRAGILRPLLDFELGAGVVRTVVQPGAQTLMLASIREASRTPLVVSDWQAGVAAPEQVAVLLTNHAALVVCDAPRAQASEQVVQAELLAEYGQPQALGTRIKVKAPGECLLVFNERQSENQEILLNGQRVTKYTANAIWPAALLPPGEHVVELRQVQQRGAMILGLITTLVVLACSGVARYAGGGRVTP